MKLDVYRKTNNNYKKNMPRSGLVNIRDSEIKPGVILVPSSACGLLPPEYLIVDRINRKSVRAKCYEFVGVPNIECITDIKPSIAASIYIRFKTNSQEELQSRLRVPEERHRRTKNLKLTASGDLGWSATRYVYWNPGVEQPMIVDYDVWSKDSELMEAMSKSPACEKMLGKTLDELKSDYDSRHTVETYQLGAAPL